MKVRGGARAEGGGLWGWVGAMPSLMPVDGKMSKNGFC